MSMLAALLTRPVLAVLSLLKASVTTTPGRARSGENFRCLQLGLGIEHLVLLTWLASEEPDQWDPC